MRARNLRLSVALALLASVLTATSPLRPSAAAAATCPLQRKSWIGGSVEICNGVLVYRDYVYDDYGADKRDPNARTTGTLARPAGDERYEGKPNTADLVDLQLRTAGDRLVAIFELNALFRPDSTIAALAIDTDDNRSTGGGEWRDLNVSSEGWEVLQLFRRGNPDTNIIRGSMPLPRGDSWRVQAALAKKDGTVMNVAFRGTNETTQTGAWWEDKQAAALAEGDISEFGHAVNVADLRNGTSSPAPAEKGFHQRVYTSRYTLPPGEGMTYEGVFGRHGDTGSVCEQEFHFLGKYQPYGIYIPDKPAPHGMQLALHGCNANHSSLVDYPGMQQRLGEEVNRIIVVPLGRGPIGYYSDISERDVLDVMKDVRSSYRVDANKIFAGGYSMGGYGAYRFAMLYPHRFAGLISWVGFTGDCFNGTPLQGTCSSGGIGNVYNFVRNLRHVPAAMLYAGADELVHVTSAEALANKFRAYQVPYIFYMHPAADHFTFALTDDWRKEAAYTADLSRVRNPARVTYRTRFWFSSPKYGIRHDRAYWVSKIRGREKGFKNIGIVSYGCGKAHPTYERGVTAGPDPVPWEADYREISGRKNVARANRIVARLRRVAHLKIGRGACLTRAPIRYEVRTDGPVKIRFSDGRVLRLRRAGLHKGLLPR